MVGYRRGVLLVECGDIREADHIVGHNLQAYRELVGDGSLKSGVIVVQSIQVIRTGGVRRGFLVLDELGCFLGIGIFADVRCVGEVGEWSAAEGQVAFLQVTEACKE